MEGNYNPSRIDKIVFDFSVSDLKQYLILNDFPSVNEAITQNSNVFKEMQVHIFAGYPELPDIIIITYGSFR